MLRRAVSRSLSVTLTSARVKSACFFTLPSARMQMLAAQRSVRPSTRMLTSGLREKMKKMKNLEGFMPALIFASFAQAAALVAVVYASLEDVAEWTVSKLRSRESQTLHKLAQRLQDKVAHAKESAELRFIASVAVASAIKLLFKPVFLAIPLGAAMLLRRVWPFPMLHRRFVTSAKTAGQKAKTAGQKVGQRIKEKKDSMSFPPMRPE